MNMYRSKVLISILSYSVHLNVVGFLLFTYGVSKLCTSVLRCDQIINNDKLLTSTAVIIFLTLLPGLSSICTLLSPLAIKSPYKKPVRRNFRRFIICLVTRGTNPETVERSVISMADLTKIDKRVEFIVVTDIPLKFEHLEVQGVKELVVPKTYVPNKAKFKARALEYFRLQTRFAPEDWVLHLDEETYIDEHCLRACFDWLEREVEHDYGQGVISFNTVNYWNNYILSYSEVVRFRDDLGRFQWSHNYMNFPLQGIHGAFLLVRGAIEDAVTWETASLVEDFWFGLQAWKLGFSGGWIPSIAREQCCWSVMDLLKQRRRWFSGMWALEGLVEGTIGKLNCLIWVGSNFEPILLFILFAFRNSIQLPQWLYILVQFYIGAGWYTLVYACILQDLDASVSLHSIAFHVILLPIFSVTTLALQLGAAVYSIIWPAESFDIVQKK